MVNVNLLKAEIIKHEFTQEEFCKKIDMSLSTFGRRLKRKAFNTDEAEKIAEVLRLKNPAEIFFSRN